MNHLINSGSDLKSFSNKDQRTKNAFELLEISEKF